MLVSFSTTSIKKHTSMQITYLHLVLEVLNARYVLHYTYTLIHNFFITLVGYFNGQNCKIIEGVIRNCKKK